MFRADILFLVTSYLSTNVTVVSIFLVIPETPVGGEVGSQNSPP